jgi:hypothetical protein
MVFPDLSAIGMSFQLSALTDHVCFSRVEYEHRKQQDSHRSINHNVLWAIMPVHPLRRVLHRLDGHCGRMEKGRKRPAENHQTILVGPPNGQ